MNGLSPKYKWLVGWLCETRAGQQNHTRQTLPVFFRFFPLLRWLHWLHWLHWSLQARHPDFDGMAPSAAATTTTQEQAAPSFFKLQFGNYKELDATDLDKDVETGKVGNNGAKV